MTVLQITVGFLGAATFSGHTPSGSPEWPPAPARLFAALVAGASSGRSQAVSSALSALENAPDPIIVAEASAGKSAISPVVPHYINRPNTADSAKAAKKTVGAAFIVGATHLGSPSGGGTAEPFGDVRTLADPVTYLVSTGDDEAVAEALSEVACQISYVGRSWDAATVSVSCVDVADVIGYAAEVAGNRRRVWVPAVVGTELRSWQPGLLRDMDTVFDSDTGARWTPGTRPVRYIPSVIEGDAQTPVAAHLEHPLEGPAIGRMMDRLPEHAYLSVYPGPHRDTGRAAYCYTVGDDASIDARVTEVEAALEGLDFEWELAPDSVLRYTGTSDVWHSEVPVAASGPGTYAADRVAVDVARAAGVAPETVQVRVTRDLPEFSRVHAAPVGESLWNVEVRTPVPVTGPLPVGSTRVTLVCGER